MYRGAYCNMHRITIYTPNSYILLRTELKRYDLIAGNRVLK